MGVRDGFISVNHGISYRDRGNKIHEFFMDKPKTKSGIRDIPLSTEMQELLDMQKQYQRDLNIPNDFEVDHAKLLGHSRVETSYNVYSHISNQKMEEVVASLQKQLI